MPRKTKPAAAVAPVVSEGPNATDHSPRLEAWDILVTVGRKLEQARGNARKECRKLSQGASLHRDAPRVQWFSRDGSVQLCWCPFVLFGQWLPRSTAEAGALVVCPMREAKDDCARQHTAHCAKS